MARRNDLTLMTASEKAIYDAIVEVEKVGADPKLTDVTLQLQNALNTLSDYLDSKISANYAATNSDPVPPNPTHP